MRRLGRKNKKPVENESFLGSYDFIDENTKVL